MTEIREPKTDERRRPARQEFAGDVTVELSPDLSIVGPGQNISAEGVFFIAEGSLPVKVRIAGRDEPVDGEIVRLESMGSGRIGVAVRFDPES